MNQQEIFNTVAAHLAQQGKRSMGPTNDGSYGCAYRGDDGLKCAVGCLISNQQYDRKMEGHRAGPVLKQYGIANLLGNIALLEELQELHDWNNPEDWKKAFTELAKKHKLEMPKLDWSACAHAGSAK